MGWTLVRPYLFLLPNLNANININFVKNKLQLAQILTNKIKSIKLLAICQLAKKQFFVKLIRNILNNFGLKLINIKLTIYYTSIHLYQFLVKYRRQKTRSMIIFPSASCLLKLQSRKCNSAYICNVP